MFRFDTIYQSCFFGDLGPGVMHPCIIGPPSLVVWCIFLARFTASLFVERQKRPAPKGEDTEKKDEEEWQLKDVVFVEDVKSVPVGMWYSLFRSVNSFKLTPWSTFILQVLVAAQLIIHSRNMAVHFHDYKSPPVNPVRRHSNLVRTRTTHFLNPLISLIRIASI